MIKKKTQEYTPLQMINKNQDPKQIKLKACSNTSKKDWCNVHFKTRYLYYIYSLSGILQQCQNVQKPLIITLHICVGANI